MSSYTNGLGLNGVQDKLEWLEGVMAGIERYPKLSKLRSEEGLAFEAIFSGADRTKRSRK